ncbi:MAG: outer membrane autotransporter protein, partial [Rickettsiales bacterium]
NLNIANEITLTANYNLSVNNILVSGNLDLGNSSKEIDGNISTSGGSATINLGSSSHTTSGDFSTLSGDILKINALNNSNIGNMEVGGNVSIASGLGLKISYDSNEGYLSDGTKIAIISGTSGFVSDLDDGDIDINNSSSNQSGLLTFKTKSVGSELFLIANRKGSETFSVNKSVAEIYQSIDKAGASASGELRDLQRLIDNSSTTNKNRESALKSLIPQNNQDLNQASLDSAKYSINITSNRVKNSLFGIKTTDSNFKNLTNNPRNFTGLSNPDILSKENISDLSKLNFDDEIFDNQAIWIQGFESSAAQQDVADADGYQYSNSGFAIGVDQEIARNLRFGISTSLSIGNVQSNSPNQKETDINSYQFNLYSGYNFESYFVTGILGVAINKYSSTRSIPDLNLIAKSSYGGQTYVGKFESGMIKEFKNGFVVSPRIGIIAARNQISTYKETGAGTLNLNISNKHNNFLEGRIGGDLSYENLKIKYIQIKPKFNLSYGYDFLGAEQSSVNSFEGQNSSFEIKNSNIDRASLKYGLGFDFYEEGGVLISFNYGVEQKKSYKAQTGSLYLRYDFW